jgi:hypothetical protein
MTKTVQVMVLRVGGLRRAVIERDEKVLDASRARVGLMGVKGMLTRGTSSGEKWKNRKNSRDFWYILGIPLQLRLFDLFLLSRNVGMFLFDLFLLFRA